jgi:hypothetical protein
LGFELKKASGSWPDKRAPRAGATVVVAVRGDNQTSPPSSSVSELSALRDEIETSHFSFFAFPISAFRDRPPPLNRYRFHLA